MNNTFKKEERLKSRKVIGQMFKTGQSFGVYPLRLVWTEMDIPRSDYPVQFTVSVPKKKFKRAVQRNRIRRQIREAWRLNKHQLYKRLDDSGKQWGFMVLFVGTEPVPYAEIERAMKTIIYRFQKKYRSSDRQPTAERQDPSIKKK